MTNIKIKNKVLTKDFLITITVILSCLGLFIYFPTFNNIQELTKDVFFFLFIPLLYIKFILKKNINAWGLNMQNKKEGFIWAVLMLLLSLIMVYIFIRFTSFTTHYSLSSLIINSFWSFLIYILIFINLILFLQEYFFRGFVLFAFYQKIGYWSILIQVGLYLIMLLLVPGNFQQTFWQALPFVILTFTGGVTAYKSKSMVYSYLSGLLFFLILTSYLIYLIKIT